MTDGPRILVVDDDPDQRFLARTLFERAGISVVAEAADADDALLQAEDHHPDLVVLDLQMPGRSGLDLLPELRSRCPGASVVVVSNLPRRHYEEQVLAAGALGYVEKRVAADRFVAEVLAAAAITAVTVERVSTELTTDPRAVGAARRWVRELLAPSATDELEVVELLVSELVTNAIVHASSAPRVEVELGRDHIRVAVHDADPTPPARRVPDLGRIGGRGLLLLDQLASRWGSEPSGGGKVVWFEVRRST
jgi:DNA-binding NarL/FixJ family response regulator